MKNYLNVIFLLAFVFYTGCKGDQEENKVIDDEQIPVKIISLMQESHAATIESSGYFTTDDETPLSFKNGGVIQKIFVREGDAVKAGQLLATVNTTEIYTAVEQARLGYEKAKRDYDRAANLYRDSVATLEQMQNAKTAMQVAKQQVDAVRYNLNHAQLRAVKSGYVLKKYLQEGQAAAPGMPVFLVNGGTSGQWLFDTNVTDHQWAAIRKGDTATIRSDVAPAQPIRAVVFRKSEGVDPQSGAFSIQLKVVDRNDVALASGLFGKAVLHPTQETEGWVIPYEAILDGDEQTAYVFVTNDKQKAREVKVTISDVNHGGVLVTSGLEAYNYLITSGSAYLKDGAAITITE